MAWSGGSVSYLFGWVSTAVESLARLEHIVRCEHIVNTIDAALGTDGRAWRADMDRRLRARSRASLKRSRALARRGDPMLWDKRFDIAPPRAAEKG
jgi:hypothetical protein